MGRAESLHGTNLPRVGGFNRAVVLDAIRRGGAVSRVELAGATRLTPQTMSNIVRELIDDGLVRETGNGPSTGGKRRVLLRIVPEACYAVGLHVEGDRVHGALVDLTGAVRARSHRRVSPQARPRTVVTALENAYRYLTADAERVLGLGLAVPGPLDPTQRHVLSPPGLEGWDEVALADTVQERTAVPVVMDNDATAAATGERWSGNGTRNGSFVYGYLGGSVGVGIVLDDQVHRGASNNAGEIGHVPHGGRRRCRCGKRGCLDAYCSMPAILADWRAAGGNPKSSSVTTGYAQLCRTAAAGDSTAVRVLRRACNRLGRALASVVSVLDVDRVVLGGPGLCQVEDLVRDEVSEAIAEVAWAADIRPVTVETAATGSDAGTVGAATLVLDHAYSPQVTALVGT